MTAREILELYEKARKALQQAAPCRITARANWLNGKAAEKDSLRGISEPDEYEACKGLIDYLDEETRELSLADDIEFRADFWTGFCDGFEQNTMPYGASDAYKAGYHAARLNE